MDKNNISAAIDNIITRLNMPLQIRTNRAYISVIIPVYNTEKYLRRCLESILNQTFRDIEVIVVNDCSHGDCKEIVSDYIRNDSRVIYIENATNIGSAWSRINGLSNSSGNYIHFVDSDDWVFDGCYEKINKYLAFKYDALHFGGINADDSRTWESDFHIQSDMILYGKRAAFDDMFFNDSRRRTLWCRVFRRDIAIAASFYMPRINLSVADDWIFNLFILFFCKSYRSVSDIFYYYYQNNEQSMTAVFENKACSKVSADRLVKDICQIYEAYTALSNFLQNTGFWNVYRFSWTLYLIRDLRYSFIDPVSNFENYMLFLYSNDREKYNSESYKILVSKVSQKNILSFYNTSLLNSTGIWERFFLKYALINLLYKTFIRFLRIRNIARAIFNISVTRTKEQRRMYLTMLGIKLTFKLKPLKRKIYDV